MRNLKEISESEGAFRRSESLKKVLSSRKRGGSRANREFREKLKKLPHYRFLPMIYKESAENTVRNSTLSGSSQFYPTSREPTQGEGTPPPDEKYKTIYLRRHSSSSP